jgi:hypothetical protein
MVECNPRLNSMPVISVRVVVCVGKTTSVTCKLVGVAVVAGRRLVNVGSSI